MKSFATVLFCFFFLACSNRKNQAKKEAKLSLDSVKSLLQGSWVSVKDSSTLKILNDTFYELCDTVEMHYFFTIKYSDSSTRSHDSNALYELHAISHTRCLPKNSVDENGNPLQIVESEFFWDIDTVGSNFLRVDGDSYLHAKFNESGR